MKKQYLIPGVAVAGGAAGFALRLVQNRSGFEAETGLAIPGNIGGVALPVLLAVLTAAIGILSWKTPKKAAEDGAFSAFFPAKDAAGLMLPVMGIFLMGISGLLDGALGLAILPGVLFAPRVHLLLGAFALVSAVGLFTGLTACRHAGADFQTTVLLAVPVMLVVRLVLTYRVSSTDPALEAYYIELLAQVLLTVAFFHLAGFAFGDGRPRRFVLTAAMAAVLAMTAAADLGSHITLVSSLALYLGGGMALLGFLLLHLGKEP